MESTREGQEMAVYFDMKYIAQSSKADPSLPWGLRHPWLRTSWNTGGHLCLGGSVASGPLVLGTGLSYVIGSLQSLCPPWPLLNSSPAHPFPSNLLASSSLCHPPSKLHTRPGPHCSPKGKPLPWEKPPQTQNLGVWPPRFSPSEAPLGLLCGSRGGFVACRF